MKAVPSMGIAAALVAVLAVPTARGDEGGDLAAGEATGVVTTEAEVGNETAAEPSTDDRPRGDREGRRRRPPREGDPEARPPRPRRPGVGDEDRPRRPGFGPPRARGERGEPGERGEAGPRRHGPRGHGSPEDAAQLFELFDIDGDQQLSREEFRRMTSAMRIFRSMVHSGLRPHALPHMRPGRFDRADAQGSPIRGRRGPGGPEADGPRRGGRERPPLERPASDPPRV